MAPAVCYISSMKIFIFLVSLACLLVSLPTTLLAASKTATIRSQAHINDMLELTISSSGASELRFGNIRSSPNSIKTEPITIVVSVISNTGQRYQVSQLLNGALENAQGDRILPEHLQFTTASENLTGTVISDPTGLIPGPQTIFISNSAGSSETIRAQYTLSPPPYQAPGNYSALLTYTASAL